MIAGWLQPLSKSSANTRTDHLLDRLAEDDWMLEGRCSQLRPETADELLFPEPGRKPGRPYDVWAHGRQLCAGCPIMLRCGEYALAAGEREGMWGGLTPEDRQHLWAVSA